MSEHKRSKLNAFLDSCPEWVQQAVWGDGGMRDEIEQLQQRVAELDGRCNGFQRQRDINLDDAMRYKQECDELAAYIERLRNEINTTVLDAVHQYDNENNGYWIITLEQLEALKGVDDQSPQTSLAEHDAEVIRKFAKWVDDEFMDFDFDDAANQYANKIRNGEDGEQ